MLQFHGIHFRVALASDVPAMAICRSTDPAAGPADTRMAAYLDREHHPHEAQLPRVGYVALAGDEIIGYIAGHRTTRHGCAGEVQYLFVAPAHRRRGIATALLALLADWFREQSVKRVCVCIDADSPSAQPFYASLGASSLKPYWRVWEDIGLLCR